MWRYYRALLYFPKEIFRVNEGTRVKIRAHHPFERRPGEVELVTNFDRAATPKALNPLKYQFPNGAMMRPNTNRLQTLIRRSIVSDLNIYAVHEGTKVPDDLLLVHDFEDHYSLQPREVMEIRDLNDKITDFLHSNATCFTKEEWLEKYPQATDFDDIDPNYWKKEYQ